jgi:hypothetical protein
MKTPDAERTRQTPTVDAAVLLWCALAGALVGVLLGFDPPTEAWPEFWSCEGALRALADLLLFTMMFLFPIASRPVRRPLRARCHSAVVITFTGIGAIVIVSRLTAVRLWALPPLLGFVALVVFAAFLWSVVCEKRPAIYFSVASLLLALPVVHFFADELLRVEAPWVRWLSPFTGWRIVLESAGKGVWGPWFVFGLLATAGIVCRWRQRRAAA